MSPTRRAVLEAVQIGYPYLAMDARSVTRQAVGKHLNALMLDGLVTRLSRGKYGLTPEGQRVLDPTGTV